MNVCFLAGTLGRGGAERQLLYMLRALAQTDVSTRVLCLTKGEFFEREIKDLGIQIDWVGASQNRIIRLLKIIKNLKQQPADILQSVHFYTNIYAGIAGRALKISSIGAIRSDLRSELAAHKLMGKWQLSLPRHLITNTELARRRALEHGISPDRINLVRNAVEINDSKEPTRLNNTLSLNILFVGRLVKLKRPDLFIKLALLLEQQLPNYQLNFQIVGDGPLRAELEQSVGKLKLKQNRVSFLGWQDDTGEIYRQARVLVLTSEYEGAPNVVLEAMAYGVPVVATKVGGVSEILDNTKGFLIEPNNEASLVTAIKQLILSAELGAEMGKKGREFIAVNHSLESVKNELNNIYSKLLAP